MTFRNYIEIGISIFLWFYHFFIVIFVLFILYSSTLQRCPAHENIKLGLQTIDVEISVRLDKRHL